MFFLFSYVLHYLLPNSYPLEKIRNSQKLNIRIYFQFFHSCCSLLCPFYVTMGPIFQQIHKLLNLKLSATLKSKSSPYVENNNRWVYLRQLPYGYFGHSLVFMNIIPGKGCSFRPRIILTNKRPFLLQHFLSSGVHFTGYGITVNKLDLRLNCYEQYLWHD